LEDGQIKNPINTSCCWSTCDEGYRYY